MSLIYSQVTNLYIVQVQTKKFHKLQKKKTEDLIIFISKMVGVKTEDDLTGKQSWLLPCAANKLSPFYNVTLPLATHLASASVVEVVVSSHEPSNMLMPFRGQLTTQLDCILLTSL